MDGINRTKTNSQKIVQGDVLDDSLMTLQQEKFITFLALGGLITEESDEVTKPNEIKQMTVTQFCQINGIARDTYYRWKRELPNLGERVRQKRYETFPISRETQIYNRLYLIGMTGKSQPAVEALKILAGHFAKLDLPVQREIIKHEGNSWLSFVQQKQQNAIEGEIVNDPQLQGHETRDPNA